ncbi:MAG: methylated-DNA--[protein]-cysteine S-methyltransferase [Candidatus Thalassarchaeaceae archaeon]
MPLETLVFETSHCRVSKIVESGKLIAISIQEGGGESLDGLWDGFDWSDLIGDIEWGIVTPFRRTVFEALIGNVPRGGLITYGELASAAGLPGSSRAVGSALSSNPWPLVVPCHRVVRSNGHIGPYSAGSGISTKRSLLISEGLEIDAKFRFDQKNLMKIAREAREATIQTKM